jgi:hypothetical protein
MNLLEALREVVTERGEDYVYPREEEGWTTNIGSCRYFLDDGTPACIFGAALTKMGYGKARIKEEVVIGTLLHELGDFTEAEELAASEAQARQDEGEPYGFVLRMYEEELTE